jgi:hypothetical protein
MLELYNFKIEKLVKVNLEDYVEKINYILTNKKIPENTKFHIYTTNSKGWGNIVLKIIDNFNYALCNNKIFVLKWANRPGNIWDFCKKTEFILPYEDLEKINKNYEYTTINEDPISIHAISMSIKSELIKILFQPTKFIYDKIIQFDSDSTIGIQIRRGNYRKNKTYNLDYYALFSSKNAVNKFLDISIISKKNNIYLSTDCEEIKNVFMEQFKNYPDKNLLLIKDTSLHTGDKNNTQDTLATVYIDWFSLRKCCEIYITAGGTPTIHFDNSYLFGMLSTFGFSASCDSKIYYVFNDGSCRDTPEPGWTQFSVMQYLSGKNPDYNIKDLDIDINNINLILISHNCINHSFFENINKIDNKLIFCFDLESYEKMKNKDVKALLYHGTPEQNHIYMNIKNEHAMIQLSKIEYDKVKFRFSNENINFVYLHLNRLGFSIKSIQVLYPSTDL